MENLDLTVVRTWGSSPRPVGSTMALCESGTVVGSVSGGCIEDDLIYRYSRANTGHGVTHDIPKGPPERLVYGVSADEAHRFGLPCGGTLELVLEFNPNAGLLKTLIDALAQGRTELATGRISQHPVLPPAQLVDDGKSLRNTFGPEYRMLLIGAGQLTEYLATMALFSGFAVTVCDPREEYRSTWSVAGVTLLTGMPDDVVRGFQLDRHSRTSLGSGLNTVRLTVFSPAKPIFFSSAPAAAKALDERFASD